MPQGQDPSERDYLLQEKDCCYFQAKSTTHVSRWLRVFIVKANLRNIENEGNEKFKQ